MSFFMPSPFSQRDSGSLTGRWCRKIFSQKREKKIVIEKKISKIKKIKKAK